MTKEINKAKAKVFIEAEKKFETREIEIPLLNPGEILVKISYSSICTSDLHTYYGRRESPRPSVLGHEIVGEIISIETIDGKDFNGSLIHKGDLITWGVYAFDKNSEMTRKGFPQKSENLHKYGHIKAEMGKILSGGFSSHIILKKGTPIFKIPRGISKKEAVPLNCTHATIAGAMRLTGSVKGKNILVAGSGMLGLSACAMSKYLKASRVFIFDKDENKLSYARDFGADETFHSNDDTSKFKEIIRKQGGVDITIDTTGSPEAMEFAIDTLNIGGIAIWVGAVYSANATRLDAEKVVRRLLTIKGLHNYIPEDLQKALEFLKDSHTKYPFESLISEEIKLDNLEKGFDLANSGIYFRIGVTQD